MITVHFATSPSLLGVQFGELERFREYDPVRQAERATIRAFVGGVKDFLQGRCLDYGCGASPYREFVQGEYVGWDVGQADPTGSFDSILCTQVFQFLPDPLEAMRNFARLLKPRCFLVMTYGTNWDEVEPEDYWRVTKSGMERLCGLSGFQIIRHERRAEVTLGNYMKFPLGYGLLAQLQ